MAKKKKSTVDSSEFIPSETIDARTSSDDSNEKTDNQIILEIQENIKNWMDVHRENIAEYRANKQFVYITQWNDVEQGKLRLAGKPVMQSNKIYDVITKMSGEYRVVGGELRVKSTGDNVTEDEIKLNEDFLRSIYFNSDSQNAFYKCFDDILVGGFGVYAVGTMYESLNSTDILPYFYSIPEPENCYFDLNAKKSHKQDGQFCGIFRSYTKKAFEAMYPDVKYPSSFPVPYTNMNFSWGNTSMITVAEEYRKQWFSFDLHILSDGRKVRDDEWERINKENKMYEEMENSPEISLIFGGQVPNHQKVTIQETIKKHDCKIIKYVAIADKIIEKTTFPGNCLPFVFVSGPDTMINGVQRFASVPKYCRDSQRLHNYVMVEIAHSMQINRKERFMATKANINNYKEIWENPLDIQGALMYDPDPINGQPPIQLQTYEVPQTLLALYNQTGQSIQDSMGYFDANRGKDTAEKSGIAIARQQMAGSLSTTVAKSNMNSAIAQGGHIIMSMRKDIFNSERTITVMDGNKKERKVKVNQKVPNDAFMYNNLTRGDYRVVFEAGPTHQMQKEIQMDFMAKIAQMTPEPQRVADLLAQMGDALPSFVERMKTFVPPEILAKEEGKDAPPQQPNPQMMMIQKQAELEEKKLQLEAAKINLEMKKIDTQMKKIEADIGIASMKTNAEVRKAALEHNKGMVDATAKIVSSHNDVRRHVYSTIGGSGNKNRR